MRLDFFVRGFHARNCCSAVTFTSAIDFHVGLHATNMTQSGLLLVEYT